MSAVATFFVGLFAGVVFGVLMFACLIANTESEEREKKYNE